MDKDKVKLYLLDFNKRRFDLVERKLEIRESNKIQTVIGARRVGKTYLLFNKIKNLEESGVLREQIIYLNFESQILSDIPYEDYNQQEIDGKIIKTIPLWMWLLQ